MAKMVAMHIHNDNRILGGILDVNFSLQIENALKCRFDKWCEICNERSYNV